MAQGHAARHDPGEPGLPSGACWHHGPDGAPLMLLPQRAAYDPVQRSLLVADVHLGKAHTFRRHGLAVPQGSGADTLQRLETVVQALDPVEIIVLGDLLHARGLEAADDLLQLRRWRQAHARRALVLVCGNHDRPALAALEGLDMEIVHQPLRRGPWALVHEPQDVPGAYALAGHVHPGVVLPGGARTRARLPCFWFGPDHGIIPAFGGFTGLHIVQPRGQDRAYAVLSGEGMVLRLPSQPSPRPSPSRRHGP